MKRNLRIRRQGKNYVIRLTQNDHMTESFSRAVMSAVSAAKANGKPVARYDRASGRSYMEYPDGKKVYEKTT